MWEWLCFTDLPPATSFRVQWDCVRLGSEAPSEYVRTNEILKHHPFFFVINVNISLKKSNDPKINCVCLSCCPQCTELWDAIMLPLCFTTESVSSSDVGEKKEKFIVQELCASQGGRAGLSVLTSLLVSMDIKLYWTMLWHWSQLVPNMSTDIWGHYATLPT